MRKTCLVDKNGAQGRGAKEDEGTHNLSQRLSFLLHGRGGGRGMGKRVRSGGDGWRRLATPIVVHDGDSEMNRSERTSERQEDRRSSIQTSIKV